MQSLNITNNTTNDPIQMDNDFNPQAQFLNSSFDSKRQYEILMAQENLTPDRQGNNFFAEQVDFQSKRRSEASLPTKVQIGENQTKV